MQLNYWVWVHLRLGSLVSVFKAQHVKVYSLLIPPVTLISAYISDRYASRGIVVIFVAMFAVAGFAIFLSKVALSLIQMFFAEFRCWLAAEHKYTSYGALYLMIIGLSGCGPIFFAWIANNSEPHYRRATSVALAVLGSNAVCFGFKCTIISHFLFFRVASWVPGVSQRRTVQNSAKQQSLISRCTCQCQWELGFSVLTCVALSL